MRSDSKLIRLLPALFLLAALCAGAAEEEKGDKARAPAKPKPKAEAPVIEIKRTGPPPCNVKPVMTDAEIETCKRQRELDKK